jgi:hypothetical protein
MDPMTIAALAGQGVKSAIGLGQAIVGSIKTKKAMRNRPNYEIMPEFQQNVKLADKVMNMGMPREQYLAQMQGYYT